MKILFITSITAFQRPSGGEYQALKYKEYLEKKGYLCKFFNSVEDKFDEFDIIHAFGLSPTIWEALKYLKESGSKSKVVLSPIYWPALEYTRKMQKTDVFLIKKLVFVFRAISTLKLVDQLLRLIDFQYSIFKLADLILPNSYTEKEAITKLFRLDPNVVRVLYNGVDEEFAKANPYLFESTYGLSDFVLYVGRIEPRKNTLNLIKAIKDTNLSLVLIGSSNPIYHDYYVLCQKIAMKASDRIKFIPNLSHDSEMLRSAYAASKVFALPSWFETPSLAALEAALAGSTIVITSKGSTKEYFRDLAFYIDNPDSIKEIRDKIIQAYNTPKNSKLRNLILHNFTWNKIIERLLHYYHECL
jgi:glycosyltransferase involved in cell wall biosynthesis